MRYILCISAIVCGAMAPMAHASLTSNFPFAQKDAPVQVVGLAMAPDDLCKAITFANVSPNTVVRVQFGTTITGVGSKSTDVAVVRYGPVFDVNIPPSEIGAVGPQALSLDAATEGVKSLGAVDGAAVTGVVYVKFGTGEEWYYPLKDLKVFVQVNKPELLQKLAPKLDEYKLKHNIPLAGVPACSPGKNASNPGQNSFLSSLRKLLSLQTVHAQNPWTFVCDPGAPQRYCSNSTSSCTTYICWPYCNNTMCCAINLLTGQKFCNPNI
jgi:hypothetical protein